MANKELIGKLANIPLAKPGFQALDMTAPVLVQMNPAGKWENVKPETLDEERLRAVGSTFGEVEGGVRRAKLLLPMC
ncbi:hypothetical protein O3G_MSEX002742 [Manduca sexta]|uniref:Uncharacterized protein n=1 Tax=Manduca sexta TaxID=7130 RepID=A0A922CEH6_MANSE|nr:hypothetical protein O3G_MSEX002742 [Manduca sexta]KAG6443197.1 hypothetical protein O3G_MSEX002742 [Manduca sexta]